MKIFLGSSEECKEDMHRVAQWIEGIKHTPIPWDDSERFRLGEYNLSSLIEISRDVDAAILIFGEDDGVWSRTGFQTQARDNVLIEYGLFTGVLGEQNTIICCKGKPKIPSDLSGRILADLDKPATAQQKISHWARRLRSKRESSPPESPTLIEILDNFSAIEKQQARRFQSWLCKKHLESTLQALKPIREQMSRHGAFNYSHEVTRHLLPDRLDTILALCGRKFTDREDNKDYFAEFYEFAKRRRKKKPQHRDGIYVCRIFVEVDEGRLAPFMDDEFKRHEASRQDGVLGLTIKSHRRSELDSHVGDGFSKCLDEGFGFLLFYDPERTSGVIIHEGTDHEMAFVELTDELNVRRILEIYKILCMKSVQYNTAERDTLKKLLKRLQLPVVP